MESLWTIGHFPRRMGCGPRPGLPRLGSFALCRRGYMAHGQSWPATGAIAFCRTALRRRFPIQLGPVAGSIELIQENLPDSHGVNSLRCSLRVQGLSAPHNAKPSRHGFAAVCETEENDSSTLQGLVSESLNSQRKHKSFGRKYLNRLTSLLARKLRSCLGN